MDNIEQLVEQIKNLNKKDFTKLTEKYFEIISLKQKSEFNKKFPNLELNEYSKVKCIKDTYYYYKFSSNQHKYEFQINKTNANKSKYSFDFFVDGQLEHSTQKITENKILIDNQLDIKTYIHEIGDDVNETDINIDELTEITNYLFFNKKFFYNIN